MLLSIAYKTSVKYRYRVCNLLILTAKVIKFFSILFISFGIKVVFDKIDFMNKIYLWLVLVSSICTLNAKNTICFAPLPLKKGMENIEEFIPLNRYLKQTLNLDIKYVYKQDYTDIIKGFKNGSIDIAYLGPLPYIYLKNNCKYAMPIVTFKQSNGKSNYQCVLSKFKEDTINRLQTIKIALTQPLSTCGYYMSNILLKNNFDINISQQKYKYTMSHTNALIKTLEGEFDIAGAKDTIAQQYESLGMEIIAKSNALPGFSLVVNTKTLSPEQVDEIQKTLLAIPYSTYKLWGGITSRGMVKPSPKEYEQLEVDFDTIPFYGNM